jgi:terminase small subunit-like protein
MRRRRIDYTDAVAARICDELRRGRKLMAICRDDGMPSRGTVLGWARANRHGFGERYRGLAHPHGTTSLYTRALADHICGELRTGRTLTDICDDPGMPSNRAVRAWMTDDRDGFAVRYRQARQIGYLAMADEIIDIADDARNDWMARRGRRRRDTRLQPRERGALARPDHGALLAALQDAAAGVRHAHQRRDGARGRRFHPRGDEAHRRPHAGAAEQGRRGWKERRGRAALLRGVWPAVAVRDGEASAIPARHRAHCRSANRILLCRKNALSSRQHSEKKPHPEERS